MEIGGHTILHLMRGSVIARSKSPRSNLHSEVRGQKTVLQLEVASTWSRIGILSYIFFALL